MYLGIDSHGLLHALPKDQPRVDSLIDMCTGSGIQAISALQHFAQRAVLVDLNPRACRFATANLLLNGIEEARFDVRVGSGWDPVGPSEAFDVLTINPPYLASARTVGEEHLYGNGGPDGEAITRKVLQGALPHLRPCGKIFLVANLYNPAQWPAKVRRWLGHGLGRGLQRHGRGAAAGTSVAVRVKRGIVETQGKKNAFFRDLSAARRDLMAESGIRAVALEGLVFIYLRPDHEEPAVGRRPEVGGEALDEVWRLHDHPWQWLSCYAYVNESFRERAEARQKIADEVRQQHAWCHAAGPVDDPDDGVPLPVIKDRHSTGGVGGGLW